MDKSETPDDSGGSAIVILIGTGVVTMHVVALDTPGEILKSKFVVDASADVDGQRVIDEATGVEMADSGHPMDERAPPAEAGREANASERIVLGYTFSIEATAVEDETESREAGEGEIFGRDVPSFIALLVDDVGKLTVGNSAVDVSTGKKATELCRHRYGEKQQAQQGQRGGNGFRHEISLPGTSSRQTSIVINEMG